MNAVTIVQITPTELEILIANTIRSVLATQESEPPEETDRWLDIKELSEYLPDKLSVPTLYGKVHTRTIPYHKKSKKLYFLKSEIDSWLKDGRNKTSYEVAEDAKQWLKRRGGK